MRNKHKQCDEHGNQTAYCALKSKDIDLKRVIEAYQWQAKAGEKKVN